MVKKWAEIGPQNASEELVFAAERFRVDVQTEIHVMMRKKHVSRHQLAYRLGCSTSWVTQIFSDDSDITLRTLGKIYHALGEECYVGAKPTLQQSPVFWGAMILTMAFTTFLLEMV